MERTAVKSRRRSPGSSGIRQAGSRNSHGLANKTAANVRDFIENDGAGRERRWAIYIGASFAIMALIMFLVSFSMGSSSANMTGEKEAISPNADSTRSDTAAKEKERVTPGKKMKDLTRALTRGAEAEAAIVPAAALGAPIRSDRLNIRDREGRGILVTGHSQRSSESMEMYNQMKELLAVVESACEKEDRDALVAMLDDEDASFYEHYLRTAERLFRSFDGINVSFTDIQVSPVNENEVQVNARVRVEGAFKFTGGWKVLSNDEQSFTLRRHDAQWKLCSVN